MAATDDDYISCPRCCLQCPLTVFRGLTTVAQQSKDTILEAVTGMNRVERLLSGRNAWELIFIGGRVTNRLNHKKLNELKGLIPKDIYEDKQKVHREAARRLNVRGDLEPALNEVLITLSEVEHAKSEIEALRKVKVEIDNEQHCQLLNDVWKGLKDFTPIPQQLGKSETSTSWSDIGFQHGPWSDFRGVGLLGLLSLNYFVMTYNLRARQVFKSNIENNREASFPFAITILNVTCWVLELLENGDLDHIMYEYIQWKNDDQFVKPFYILVSWIFLEFSRMWRLAMPRSIMQFREVSSLFRKQLQATVERLSLDTSSWADSSTTIEELDKWIRGECCSRNLGVAVK